VFSRDALSARPATVVISPMAPLLAALSAFCLLQDMHGQRKLLTS